MGFAQSISGSGGFIFGNSHEHQPIELEREITVESKDITLKNTGTILTRGNNAVLYYHDRSRWCLHLQKILTALYLVYSNSLIRAKKPATLSSLIVVNYRNG